MSQPSFWQPEPARLWTVAELNRYLRELLDTDLRLQDLWVAGELSNLSRPASGHLYFTLKDDRAALRCVMWRPEAARLGFAPRDGQAVEAHGRISLYEAGGQLQLYADTLRPAGEGALFQAFVQLKARLEAEGLFEPARKRPPPAWPGRIGLVTSPSGAALRDVLHTLQRRFPLAEVILSPAPVQGEEAPAALAAALEALEPVAPDVILLVRGGGSLEDLQAFNDERLARAIAASPAPVVTGVGHETDFTIADFVADVRAPTPTAAAELATPDRQELLQRVGARRAALAAGLAGRLRGLHWSLRERQAVLQRLSPRAQLANARQRTDDLARRAAAAVVHALDLRRARLRGAAQALQAVGPGAVLARGYALVERADDRALLRSVRQVRPGDRLHIRLADGRVAADAREVEPADEPPGGL